MTEELEKRISDEQCEQLTGRIREAHAEGVLKIRDWIVADSFNDVEGGIQ